MVRLVVTKLKTFEATAKRDPEALVFDSATRVFSRHGETTSFPNRQTDVILAMAAGAGSIVTWPELVNRIWGSDPHGGPDDPRNTIMTHVCRARPSLERLGLTTANWNGVGLALREAKA